MSALVSFLATFASETVANDLRNISKHLDTFAMAETNPKFPEPEPKSLFSWLHSLLRLRPMLSAPSRSTWTHSPRLNETLNAPNPNQNRSFLGYIRFWDFGQKSLYHQQALGHIRHGWPKPWKFCKFEPKPLSIQLSTQPHKSDEYLLKEMQNSGHSHPTQMPTSWFVNSKDESNTQLLDSSNCSCHGSIFCQKFNEANFFTLENGWNLDYCVGCAYRLALLGLLASWWQRAHMDAKSFTGWTSEA